MPLILSWRRPDNFSHGPQRASRAGDRNFGGSTEWIAEHGGQFVLAASLTLADQQRDFFVGVLDERFLDLANPCRGLYPEGSYDPFRSTWKQIALRLKELCERTVCRIATRSPSSPRQAHSQQTGCRGVRLWAQLDRAARRGQPPRVGHSQGRLGDRGLGAGLGLDLPPEGRKGPESIENL